MRVQLSGDHERVNYIRLSVNSTPILYNNGDGLFEGIVYPSHPADVIEAYARSFDGSIGAKGGKPPSLV